MDKNKLISGLVILVILLVVVGIFSLIFSRHQLPKYSLITDYAHCAAAGYPVDQSSPRICRLPDGETFVESVRVVQQCAKDADCAAGQYCDSGQCQDFVANVSCRADADCKLINKTLLFGCCWAGVCEPVDYSNDNWIAVNRQWFSDTRTKVCNMLEQACGPRPACSVQLINDSYEPRCIGDICYKRPVGH